MILPVYQRGNCQRFGKDRKGNQRFRCKDCGVTWVESQPKPLGDMRVDVA